MSTRKKHWTRFLSTDRLYGRRDYTKLPRKIKKEIKNHYSKILYYNKVTGVTVFSRSMLRTPIPSFCGKIDFTKTSVTTSIVFKRR